MPLAAASRAALAAGAFASFAGAFVLGPAAVHAQHGTPSAPAGASGTTASSGTVLAVPRRDPFAEPPGRRVAAAARPAVDLPPKPGALAALPANAGAPPLPFATRPPAPATSPPRILAVVTGTHAAALVADAGTTRVLTIGDRLGGTAVAAIGEDRIRLTDGTEIRFAPVRGPR